MNLTPVQKSISGLVFAVLLVMYNCNARIQFFSYFISDFKCRPLTIYHKLKWKWKASWTLHIYLPICLGTITFTNWNIKKNIWCCCQALCPFCVCVISDLWKNGRRLTLKSFFPLWSLNSLFLCLSFCLSVSVYLFDCLSFYLLFFLLVFLLVCVSF